MQCIPAAPVAGVEVVGRSISLYMPKLALWNEGTVDMYDPNMLQHRVHLKDGPSGEEQQWVHLGRSQFRWLSELASGTPANPTHAGKPRQHDAVGWRVRVFWPAMGRWYQGKVKDYDASTGKHLLVYKDGDVQNAMLRNEAVEWLDKPASSARSGSPQKARSKVSSGATSHADGASPTSKARPSSKGPSSPQRKRSRLQSTSHGSQLPKVSKSGQSVRRAATGQDSFAPSASTQSDHQTSRRRDVDAQAPLRVVNSVAEHQAKRARSAQAEASIAKSCNRPPNNPHSNPQRPSSVPTQATSSTAPHTQASSLSRPAVQKPSSPVAPSPGKTASAANDSPCKRKGPPSILASIVVSMDEMNGAKNGQQLQQVASVRHPVADGWSLPAGLYPSYPSSSGAAPENPMQARLDSHAQAGPRIACSQQKSPTCMKSGGSPSAKAKAKAKARARQHAPRDGVTAKITSGRGRGHKTHRAAEPGRMHSSSKAGASGSSQGVSIPIQGPLDHMPGDPYLSACNDGLNGQASSGENASLGDTALSNSTLPSSDPHDSQTPSSSNPQDPPPPAHARRGPGRGRKGSAGPGRLTGKRRHSGANAGQELSECREDDLSGARLSIYWTQDEQFYKAFIVLYDSYHKRCKVQYDDGEEEWLALPKQRFRWLLPRAQSAGCTAAMQASMAALGAEGIQPSSATSSAPGWLADQDQGTPSIQQSLPQGQAAVGGRLLVRFNPTGEMFGGEVLAWSECQKQHHVLYDDGEEEWMNLSAEDGLVWQGAQRGTSVSPGIPEGQSVPKGRAAVGWRIAVHWKEDAKFYAGEVISFDTATGRHEVLYDDGEKEHISLTSEKVKWVLPSNGTSTAEPRRVARSERSPGVKRGRGRPRHHHLDDAQGDVRPGKRPRLRHIRSPRSTLLLNVTSAAQEASAAAAAAALSPMATPIWAGFGTPGPSAEADELAGVEPVLQRNVVASSLSAKAGRPVAIERVRLICRCLQTNVDDPLDTEAPAEPAPVQPADEAAEPMQAAADGPANAESSGCSEPCKAPGAADGSRDEDVVDGSDAVKAVPVGPAAGTSLQQRQKLMERMQHRLAGLTMPTSRASPGQMSIASPLVTPLASPTSTMWTTPLTSPLSAQTNTTAHSAPSCITASPLETPAHPGPLHPAATPAGPEPLHPLSAAPAELPPVEDARGQEGGLATSASECPDQPAGLPDQSAKAPQAEAPAKFAIKALRGVGRTLHVSPSPLSTIGNTHPHSIVSGLVGQLQGLHPSVPRKPSRLQDDSKLKPVACPSTESSSPASSSIIHPGVPISSHGGSFFTYFHRPVADRQQDPGHAHSSPAEAGKQLVADPQEPPCSGPVTSPASGAAPNADKHTMDIKVGHDSDLAKPVGSRNPSVGIPDTPSLGQEERGMFTAALCALDSGLGGSLSSTGPSVGPATGGSLSRKGSGHSLDLDGIAEDHVMLQGFLAKDNGACLASEVA
ncbi:hypothetical protein WJX74_001631 [Apatococcus lobatus]|uniref:Tudor domain-containing protein n=1 Tax=Apatococcus lobatus TaxID=904363 RepID=A0AAW1RGU8_9CHLO